MYLDVFFPLSLTEILLFKNLTRRTTQKPWYDADCEAKRREFHKRRNMYRNNSCEENLNAQHAASKEYKTSSQNQYVKI